MIITVLGAGSWGTAQAHHLRRAGHEVTVWAREKDVLADIANGKNEHYFPGLRIADGIKVTDDLSVALKGRELVVFAVPSSAYREVSHNAAPSISSETIVVSSAKGLEPKTQLRMSEVLAEELGRLERLVVLSGPSFARELILNHPTAVTFAGSWPTAVKTAVKAYHYDNFRAYSSNDVIGVEMGGVVKNVIALATGITDGCAMGDNARAALLTRGIAEIARLVIAMGGRESTVSGLSGIGDLILTSTGDLSRNRQVGLRLGRGEKLENILVDIGQVAEGVKAAESCLELAELYNIDTPIIRETEMVLKGEHSVKEAVANLLSRSPKREN